MSQAELRQALALLFRRFREEKVYETELTKVISLSLGWAKPSQAPHLLERGVQAGLLQRHGEAYTATFDANDIELPFGFRPPDELFEAPPEAAQGAADAADAAEPASAAQEDVGEAGEASPPPEAEATDQQAEPALAAGEATPSLEAKSGPLEALLDKIAEHREGGRKAAVAAVNAKQEALDGIVTLDAAALLVAAEHGVDVVEDAGDVLKRLKETS